MKENDSVKFRKYLDATEANLHLPDIFLILNIMKSIQLALILTSPLCLMFQKCTFEHCWHLSIEEEEVVVVVVEEEEEEEEEEDDEEEDEESVNHYNREKFLLTNKSLECSAQVIHEICLV